MNHKGGRVTDRLKAVGSAAMGRRTETGYEAWATGASEQMIAKLPWPRGTCVNPAVVWRRPVFLPGEISPDT